MTYGVDADFLVAIEIREHPFHPTADALLSSLLAAGAEFAVAPQTLAEFIHVVTDPKRMPNPLTLADATARAEHWWHAKEVLRIFRDGAAVSKFLTWLNEFDLGRKRILDILLAASLQRAGVHRLITNNERDFQVLGSFEIVRFDGRS